MEIPTPKELRDLAARLAAPDSFNEWHDRIMGLAIKHDLSFYFNHGGGQFVNSDKRIDAHISTEDNERDYFHLLSCLQKAGLEPVADVEMVPAPKQRRFVSIKRTSSGGYHTIDAIDDEGQAWWLIAGRDDAPEDWTKHQPLPLDNE